METVRDEYVESLHVRVFSTREEMGRQAGLEAADSIRRALAEKAQINVMFAAASSQNEMLQTLCGAEDIPWERVHAFHMDEYIGLDKDSPAGFANFLRDRIFDRLPFGAVYLLDGNAEPEEKAERYEKLLAANPLDICLLGVGENGHLAFNDPPVADFADRRSVKIVELEETCRLQQVHDGCFARIDQVPTHALTVTIPALTAAKKMICTVPGAAKASAVERMLRGAVETACPASILRRHSDAVLYVDAAAAGRIL